MFRERHPHDRSAIHPPRKRINGIRAEWPLTMQNTAQDRLDEKILAMEKKLTQFQFLRSVLDDAELAMAMQEVFSAPEQAEDVAPTNVKPLSANMQKVVVAREFSSSPKILIAAQPTRGIDVGATEFIREQLVKKRTDGAAILLVSADLAEVMSLSDRIITMFEGEITGVFPDASKIKEEELGYYMLGVKRQSEVEMEALL